MTGEYYLTGDQWFYSAMIAVLVMILVVLVYALATSRRPKPSGDGSRELPRWLEKLANEPAAISGAIGALVALGASFGLNMSSEQVGAITAIVVGLTAWYTRQHVSPVRKVKAQVEEALYTPVPESD